MKIKVRRPSPAMAVALLALFLAVVAYGLGRNSVHSRDIAPGAVRANDLGKFRLRTSGAILDRDSTAHDGIFAGAGGRAKCKPWRRVVYIGKADLRRALAPVRQFGAGKPIGPGAVG